MSSCSMRRAAMPHLGSLTMEFRLGAIPETAVCNGGRGAADACPTTEDVWSDDLLDSFCGLKLAPALGAGANRWLGDRQVVHQQDVGQVRDQPAQAHQSQQQPRATSRRAHQQRQQQQLPGTAGVFVPEGVTILPSSSICVGEQIARGAFGKVHAGTYTPSSSSSSSSKAANITEATPTPVVVKSLLPEHAKDTTQCKAFMDEAVICQYLENKQCAGVVKFYGVVLGSDWFGIVQERYEGSLDSQLSKYELSPRQQCQVILAAAKSLASIHAAGVLHLDVKSMNCMCRLSNPADIQVVLGDMGLSAITDESLVYEGVLGFGTLLWMCPEVHWSHKQSEGCVSDKADVFAFGVTMWEVLTGAQEFPYDDLPESVDISKTVTKDNLRPSIPRSWRRDWHRALSVLMQECWSDQPKLRPTMKEVVLRLEKILPELSDK